LSEPAHKRVFSVTDWVKVYFLWRPNLPDEADKHLIELALAGSAETIVTNNLKDLRNGELRFPGLKIQSPRHTASAATCVPLLPEEPECRVASLMFHHSHPDGISADDSKKDHIGKTLHERPPDVATGNHPPGWHGCDRQNLTFKLIHKITSETWRTRFVVFTNLFQLDGNRRVVVDPHLLKRLIKSLWEIGATAPDSSSASRANANAKASSSLRSAARA
jgi:hypothetical protein